MSAVLAVLAVAILAPASAQADTADLAVDKSDSPDPVTEGAALTYTINVTNAGPGTAHDVTVTDDLSTQLTYVSATASQGTCDLTGKTVRCAIGQLDSGESATVTIKVTAKKAGSLTNTASVSLGQADTDPVTTNNTATATTMVVAAGGGGGGGGATCAGHAVTQAGTGGADTIVGTAGRDVIKARGGNDVIRGLQSKDFVCAGSGKDTLKGGGGGDRLKGGRGRDLLKGGGGRDALRGGPGHDVCKGGPGRDSERSC
ncbi:MAG TPA: CARDB domain-containing protein [Solirubrobacterales bacterium]|nr:CARDB domain-containing protein [Solirubrobacterales bacterium]